jgi:hypothetical protein
VALEISADVKRGLGKRSRRAKAQSIRMNSMAEVK